MTITQAAKAKAVELANRESAPGDLLLTIAEVKPTYRALFALARVLQEHSDAARAIKGTCGYCEADPRWESFILPDAPDPLEEAGKVLDSHIRQRYGWHNAPSAAVAALDAAGYQITRKDGV